MYKDIYPMIIKPNDIPVMHNIYAHTRVLLSTLSSSCINIYTDIYTHIHYICMYIVSIQNIYIHIHNMHLSLSLHIDIYVCV